MHKPIFILSMNTEYNDYIPSPDDVFETVSNHYDYVTETKSYTIDHLRHQLSDMFGTVKEENGVFTVKKEQIEKYLKKVATRIRSHTRKLEFDKIPFWRIELIYDVMLESSAFFVYAQYYEGFDFATYLYEHTNRKNEISFTYEAVYDAHC